MFQIAYCCDVCGHIIPVADDWNDENNPPGGGFFRIPNEAGDTTFSVHLCDVCVGIAAQALFLRGRQVKGSDLNTLDFVITDSRGTRMTLPELSNGRE